MTDKNEATAKLSEMGFTATVESGVVMITVGSISERKAAEKAIKDISYVCSWGVRVKGNNDEKTETVCS